MSHSTNIAALRNDLIIKYKRNYELNDSSHLIEHFRNVEDTGNEINEVLDLHQDPLHIMLVAYFHDLFAWSRENHHLLAHKWVMTTECPFISRLTIYEREFVAKACGEHRSTYVGKFSSTLSELMSAADRERPGSIQKLLVRSINYHISLGKNNKDAVRDAIRYLKEKYGSRGYARFPGIYVRVYGRQLAIQRTLVDQL
jgi:hypothetical protein